MFKSQAYFGVKMLKLMHFHALLEDSSHTMKSTVLMV